MNIYQSHESLCHVIRDQGQRLRDLRQVSKRLRELLPNRLAELKSSYRSQSSAAQAERQALTDSVYHDFLTELLEIYEAQLRAQVEFESHRMLLQARQSLRNWAPRAY